jgi:hypothetical protein
MPWVKFDKPVPMFRPRRGVMKHISAGTFMLTRQWADAAVAQGVGKIVAHPKGKKSTKAGETVDV